MATRSNALSEIIRFWLQDCNGLFIRESIPVKFPRGLSDIDFAVSSPNGKQVNLLGKVVFTNAIIESKDERDYDANGNDFLKRLEFDSTLLGDDCYIKSGTKCNFSMFREESYTEAKEIFGVNTPFSRIFIVHHLKQCDQLLQKLAANSIYFINSEDVLSDIYHNFNNKKYRKNAGVRNSLIGDIFDFLITYHGWKPNKYD